jgi:lipoate-protein ligase A
MAVDEALLRHAAERPLPLLRCYSWDRPAVSFGYFQKFPAHLADRYTLVRRPTGGGIVYHDHDTTYTVVVPPGHTLHRHSTSDAYCVLHRAVLVALQHRAELAASELRSPSGQYECFQNPVHGDVVATDGNKLAGGAQRRAKWGMLHQGSIAAPVAVEQLQEGFRAVLEAEFTPYELTAAERALACQLAREKYSTLAWNKRLT